MHTTIFNNPQSAFLAISHSPLSASDTEKLTWLLQAQPHNQPALVGTFIGPRPEMVTPWSTNAVEIAERVGVKGITRIEEFISADSHSHFDPMLQLRYSQIDQATLQIEQAPQANFFVSDITAFNRAEGLALSDEEVSYLEQTAETQGRRFTDAEVYSFAQINSEHCRHKIFNGSFVIDGVKQPSSLFDLIKATSKAAPSNIISAYKDNVAFIRGTAANHFAPTDSTTPPTFDFLETQAVVSIKAETHNFPTTVEPFYGASTGSGGEIRDRMAGGLGSLPLTGTAVYMSGYPRLNNGSIKREWETKITARKWKFQSPAEILSKASNGASDFGNKFGQPLTCGSVLTYEGSAPSGFYSYDRAVMLAGGVGTAREEQAVKAKAQVGDKLVLLGGDNYRIGMGGSAVSSVASGSYSNAVELSAIQRANPEMQKRVFNVIRTLTELAKNPILLIHDHGAGGHINCFSELLEPLGGEIWLDRLPLGDPTLSVREIICNESQERIGLIVRESDIALLQQIAARERAPIYVVGEVTGSGAVVFKNADGSTPVNLSFEMLFGSTPKSVLEDKTERFPLHSLEPSKVAIDDFGAALKSVLALESVGSKDWLTNKVDRSVTARIAQQQTVGPRQLPLSNLAITTLDYTSTNGIATAIGHAPTVGLLDSAAGARCSVAEALTNIIWVPLRDGLAGVALSANWIWPAKQPGEDARLYQAVQALSELCIALNIPVPTGKDSLSMTMQYPDSTKVCAPGTVIVTAVGVTENFRKAVQPVLQNQADTVILYCDLSSSQEFNLGGSALEQTFGKLAWQPPDLECPEKFTAGFLAVQKLISEGKVIAGHDVSAGGIISALCEMAFAGDCGVEVSWPSDKWSLFCEKPALLLQLSKDDSHTVISQFTEIGLQCFQVGKPSSTQNIAINLGTEQLELKLTELFEAWYDPSYRMEQLQVAPELAKERKQTISSHKVSYTFPTGFSANLVELGINLSRTGSSPLKAAVVRDKGTNSEREMAFALNAAGFEVADIAMEDLLTGKADFSALQFLVFAGGFSNSDVLGAARGWAGAFKYNEHALKALANFYARPDTLSLGVCNGCQLMAVLDLMAPGQNRKPAMAHNHSKKFESIFLEVDIRDTSSILLKPLIGSRLGIWVSHGEGKFVLPEPESHYDLPLRYVSNEYPCNPNGSPFNAAAIVTPDGRHLAMMPHLERSLFPWNWGYYPRERAQHDEISPWFLPFVAAREWIKSQ